MSYWAPTRRELAVELLALLVLPGLELGTAIWCGVPPYVVVLLTIGAHEV